MNNYDEMGFEIEISKTQIIADRKRDRLKVPIHPFTSNRFVKNNIIEV